MREPLIVSEGWELVREGLGEDTLRDPLQPRWWRGLTADDSCLLSAWLYDRVDLVQELHTDVPVGSVPAWVRDLPWVWQRRHVLGAHPLRIDVVARMGDGWYVLECKPDAGYLAVGQVLTYLHYARVCIGVLERAAGGVITNKCQEVIRPVFERYGLTVFEVGSVVSLGV